MLFLPIVSTAIAIIVSWALFAMFCSFAHEAMAQIKAERGRFMRKYLFKQLQDLPNGVNWASMLYLHGTINLLSREANRPTNDIQPDVFAKTLVEIVGNAHIVQMQLPLLQQHLLAANANEVRPLQTFAHPAHQYYSNTMLFHFKAATQVLKPSAVVSMLTQAMNHAEMQTTASSTGQQVTEAEIYQHLIIFIEKWYSDFTERLSYWYKKKTKQRLFILGCLLGLLLNVDSIQLFSFYTTNPASREAVINYYQQNADTLNRLARRIANSGGINTDSAVNALATIMPSEMVVQMDTTLKHLRRQDNPAATPVVLDNAAARALEDSITAARNGITPGVDSTISIDSTAPIAVHNPAADTLQLLSKTFLSQVDSLRKTADLPIGYQYSVFRQPVPWFYPILLKILGVLISGLAASFGGPFWFDVLKRMYTRK